MVKNHVKQYHNEELQKILEKDLTEYRYGPLDKILQDIFQRRAYEFNYSNEEMQDQLNVFLRRVKSIKFVSKENISGYKEKDVAGRYNARRKCIELNRDYYDDILKMCDGDKEKAGQVFYEIITHEVYHAISHRNDKELGLSNIIGIGIYGVPINTMVNEAFTEVAASRVSKNRTDGHFINRESPTMSYSEITFFPMLLSNAIGSTEREVLSKGLVGSRELDDLIFSKFPEECREDVKNYLTKMELHLNALYKIASDKKFLNIDRGKKLLKTQIVEIADASYKLLGLQMQNDTRPLDGSIVGEYNFRVQSINRITDNYLIRLNNAGLIDREFLNEIMHEVDDKTDFLRMNSISYDTEFLLFLKNNGVSEESIKKVKSYIYDGTFKEHSDEIKEETGYRFKDYYDYKAAYVKRNGNSKNLFEGDTNFSQKIREEDYHELDESKNRELFLQVAEFCDIGKNKFVFSDIPAAIASGIRKAFKLFDLTNRRIRKLPEPKEEYKYDEDSGYDTKVMSDFDKQLRVDIDFKKATQVQTDGKKKDDSELSL